MKRSLVVMMLAALAALSLPPAAHAVVNVERSGAENPMVEIAKSTVYGGLAGLLLGGALALATNTDHGGDFVKWGFVGGTFFGFGYGIYHVTSRPAPTAMLSIENGEAQFAIVAPHPALRGGARLDLVSLRF